MIGQSVYNIDKMYLHISYKQVKNHQHLPPIYNFNV